jgi:hypothetical protein
MSEPQRVTPPCEFEADKLTLKVDEAVPSDVEIMVRAHFDLGRAAPIPGARRNSRLTPPNMSCRIESNGTDYSLAALPSAAWHPLVQAK